MATVKLTPAADEQMERLPKTIRRLILKLTDRLENGQT
jgi:mRNA-degrading endonuclease RelE of RelBE toxin-antitoxin system